MSSHRLPNVPSLRKNQLLLEFASLKHAPPPGVYVSVNPGDPTLWTGVLFVRNGPYASAILRFSIRFPPSYPELPPLVIFTTDIFHPLIVPLTTYTFTTGSSNDDPVSATDEERLPPGGFSLRHGFPHWFGRAQKTANSSAASSRNVSGDNPAANITDSTKGPSSPAEQEPSTVKTTSNENVLPSTPVRPQSRTVVSQIESSDANMTSPSRLSPAPAAAPYAIEQKTVPVAALLDYIRSTFDDASILDSLPLAVAGNPGAWHAWNSHRKSVKGFRSESRATDTGDGSAKKSTPQARLPGEWNWEGVWAKRVRSGIEASQSDAMLFGNLPRGTDETIRFTNMDEATVDSVKAMMLPHVEGVSE